MSLKPGALYLTASSRPFNWVRWPPNFCSSQVNTASGSGPRMWMWCRPSNSGSWTTSSRVPHGSSTNPILKMPGSSRTGETTFTPFASNCLNVASMSATENPRWSTALPALGCALAMRRNMRRVLPYISRSGASVMRLPPKFFSYHAAAAAGSGTLTCTWS